MSHACKTLTHPTLAVLVGVREAHLVLDEECTHFFHQNCGKRIPEHNVLSIALPE